MPIIISAKARQKSCSVSRSGIGMPQTVVEQGGWHQGKDKVEIGYISDAKCILISKNSKNTDAFLVGYANTRFLTGARISCQAFTRGYLQAVVVLPIRNITPIIFSHDKWRLALILEELPWQTGEFSKKGVENIDNNLLGVYQLLGRQNTVLRIGEGKIKQRLNSHLADHRKLIPIVKAFRFATITMKEDAELLEKILIASYEAETGIIPPLNEIRA